MTPLKKKKNLHFIIGMVRLACWRCYQVAPIFTLSGHELLLNSRGCLWRLWHHSHRNGQVRSHGTSWCHIKRRREEKRRVTQQRAREKPGRGQRGVLALSPGEARVGWAGGRSWSNVQRTSDSSEDQLTEMTFSRQDVGYCHGQDGNEEPKVAPIHLILGMI